MSAPTRRSSPASRCFSLDDTTLASRLGDRPAFGPGRRRRVCFRRRQKAFDNLQSKSEITLLNGPRAGKSVPELAAITNQLARIEVLAVPTAWLSWRHQRLDRQTRVTGRAHPATRRPGGPRVLVHLPVADAIALEEGAPFKLTDDATARGTQWRDFPDQLPARLSDDGIPATGLRGRFSSPASDLRIGLRGTAKVSGGWVVSWLYLIRRPLAALRERLGV